MSDSRPSPAPNEGPGVAVTPSVRAVERIPRNFGRYRILEVLGRGGMGAVFKAHDTQLDRTVALKVPFLGNDDVDTKRRFEREARAAATLQHANICPVFDVGEFDGIPYLTMAFIEGRSLAKALEAGPPFTPQQVAVLVRKLALAMQEAHSHGVVHRDLKPANVLIRSNGEPVIMDFGLARRGDDRQTEGLTRRGDVIGTPEYMSPEQVEGDNDSVGPAADVYALGVVLFELLTGRRPFAGTTASKLAAILVKDPPRPSELRPGGVPAKLEEICLKAMAKKPADRHASMAQFAAALAEYLRNPRKAPTPPPARPAEAVPTPKPDVTRPAQEKVPPPEPVAVKPPGPPSGVRRPRSGARRKKAKKRSDLPLLIGGALLGATCAALLVIAFVQRSGKEPNVEQAAAPPASGPAYPTANTQPATSVPPPPPPDKAEAATPPPKARRGSQPKSSAPAAPPPAPKPALALQVKPDPVKLAVGEERKVTVRIDRQGQAGPVTLRWTGPAELRVSPAGPLTLQPGEPDPVLTLRLMAEPAGAGPKLDLVAEAGPDAQGVKAEAHAGLGVTPGPCTRVVELGGGPDAGIDAMALAGDGSVALVAGGQKAVHVWNLARGEPAAPLPESGGKVTTLAVSADGKTALGVGADETVSLWDLAKNRREWQSPKQPLRVLGAAMSPDAKWGLVAYPGLALKVNLDKFQAVGQPIKTGQMAGGPEDSAVVAVSGTRKGIVGGPEGKLLLIDMAEKARPESLSGHREAVSCAAFSPTGRQAATAGGSSVCVWTVAGASLKWRSDDVTGAAAVAFSADGRLLAAGDGGGQVRVWEAEDGKPVATFKGHAGRVLALAFTADGKALWSGSADRTLRRWRLP